MLDNLSVKVHSIAILQKTQLKLAYTIINLVSPIIGSLDMSQFEDGLI